MFATVFPVRFLLCALSRLKDVVALGHANGGKLLAEKAMGGTKALEGPPSSSGGSTREGKTGESPSPAAVSSPQTSTPGVRNVMFRKLCLLVYF